MKKIYTLLLLVACMGMCERVKGQWVNIPDANFVTWLNANGFSGAMSGNMMDTTNSGVVNATLVGCVWQSISDLNGIQYFDNLDTLYCTGNNLITLPQLPHFLKYLDCSNNILTNLPIIPPFLLELECHSNQITNLPTLPASLGRLICSNNQLINLPTLPSSIYYLDCGNNQLSNLPTLPSSLSYFVCVRNQLTSLPPLPNIIGLYCGRNQITSLPFLPQNLTYLFCEKNQLSNIPNFQFNLGYLHCDSNALLNCLPDLKNVIDLSILGTGINCLPNRGQLTGTWLTYPLCNVFNSNGCNFYWNMAGTAYIDSNYNCINNTGEVVINNQKINLYNSGVLQQQVFTNGNGEYNFDVNMFDTFTYTVDTFGLPFSISCPSSNLQTSIISALDSTDTGMDFGFHCNTVKTDVGVLSMVRDSGRIRPTSFATIKINAGDVAHLLGGNCPNTSSGQLNVTINGQATYQGMAVGATPPTTVSGNTLTWNIADWGAVNYAIDFHIRIKTDSFAVVGNQICITAIVTTTGTNFIASNDTLTQCFNIVNSHDPNEKEVSATKYIPTTFHDWLVYTVHFQNTGNAPAIDILVKDTLDSNIDVSTFQLLGASADNFTQVLPGGIVHFNFPNINLIDSLTNEPLSHGWVQYKVKLNSGLPLGTHINNTAAIYFDFNPPIYTNKTTNIISNLLCNDTYAPIEYHIICSNQTFSFKGNNLNTTGVYYDTLTNAVGCDSIITLNLTVNLVSNTALNQTICNNQTYLFKGNNLNTTGTYIDTLVNYHYCDSIITLHLTVNPISNSSFTQTICSNQVYSFNGANLNIGGTYYDTLVNYHNCDSLITLYLTVNQIIGSSFNHSICPFQTYFFNGSNLTVGGIYYDTLINYHNCDSVITLHLTVNPTSGSSFNQSICFNTSYLFNGVNHSSSGTYYDTLINYLSCDSIVTLHLTVMSPILHSFNQSTCINTGYFFNGHLLTGSGIYYDTLAAVNGCDSVLQLHLTLFVPSGTLTNQTICQGDNYLFNGNTYWQTGSYTAHFTNYHGCDSTSILNLTVTPLDTSVTIHGDSLLSTASGGAQQWIDCNTAAVVSTGHIFVPTTSGSYALVVFQGACTDTSSCYSISVVNGVEQLVNSNQELMIYPNPVGEGQSLVIGHLSLGNTIHIYDVLGRSVVMLSVVEASKSKAINVANLSSGVYFIKLTDEKGNVRVGKFVKE